MNFLEPIKGLGKEIRHLLFLFNLMADALGRMLTIAKDKGLIKGLMTHLLPEGLTHVQYADDTEIMVEPTVESIRNLKLILYCFEFMSGLKINFHKSEVYMFGLDPEEEWMWANMLNCKVGKMPICYLGIPISDQKLRRAAFEKLVLKMRCRLDPWKAVFS